ncbi:NAD(+) diphosphatase [Shewanella salipaludis]|uniref:NAD(+) diphosphatase n=1 Tax=Shewanella salipaludis TaxID=2723052 RepID=A0A972JK81_9GAMM|nr:NAD(+) diphosphatase [Shewanella salipaludis]NMH65930.1 NAD(+) diphosphatase [Shewanella salipaludis]
MLKYSAMMLNRASADRKDPKWLAARINHASRWLLTHSDDNFFCKISHRPLLLSHDDVAHLDLTQGIFLGLDEAKEECAYFALDMTHLDNSALSGALAAGEFIDLRKAALVLENPLASMLALARGLSFWHRSHRFCGRCGTENIAIEAGHARACPNGDCGHLTFPRTDPAVIMLVQRRFADGVERCLLGRQAIWPEGVFSTLAGFVDPGETLEQAVGREVLEEAGISVTHVRYIASQPWPFPASIMLGFIADATTESIRIDKDEIDEARWFSRAELAEFGEWGDEGPGLKLTRHDSISRYLIEYWRDLKC